MEDSAQERFILGLVENIVVSNFPDAAAPQQDVRSASGGRPRVVAQLRRYLRDIAGLSSTIYDIVLVTIDGNCQGFTEMRNGIMRQVNQTQYPGAVVCAIPDPHIERWYLADPENLAKVLASHRIPKLPPYKCERSIYKSELAQTLSGINVKAPLGGTEYGREIAKGIDLFTAGQNDPSFQQFVDDFRGAAVNFLSP